MTMGKFIHDALAEHKCDECKDKGKCAVEDMNAVRELPEYADYISRLSGDKNLMRLVLKGGIEMVESFGKHKAAAEAASRGESPAWVVEADAVISELRTLLTAMIVLGMHYGRAVPLEVSTDGEG